MSIKNQLYSLPFSHRLDWYMCTVYKITASPAPRKKEFVSKKIGLESIRPSEDWARLYSNVLPRN